MKKKRLNVYNRISIPSGSQLAAHAIHLHVHKELENKYAAFTCKSIVAKSLLELFESVNICYIIIKTVTFK